MSSIKSIEQTEDYTASVLDRKNIAKAYVNEKVDKSLNRYSNCILTTEQIYMLFEMKYCKSLHASDDGHIMIRSVIKVRECAEG